MIRRSRKKRRAPRVAGESSIPKTWMLGIFFVGVLPRGAGTGQALVAGAEAVTGSGSVSVAADIGASTTTGIRRAVCCWYSS